MLSRRPGETLLFFPGEDLDPSMTVGELFSAGPVAVTLTAIGCGEVRLGIDASAGVKVLRGELAGE